MLIYFHIDEMSRDAIVASALRDELKRIGGKLIYGNRMTTAMLRYFNVFDAVILPSLGHYMSAFPNPRQLPDNIVILPSEAVGQATGHLRRINGKYFGNEPEAATPWHQSVAQYLLWGFDHVRPFQEFYPAYIDKCKVVGHPRLADVCVAPVKPRTSSKPVIGFATRFNLLNVFDGRKNFSHIYQNVGIEGETRPKFENSENHDIEDLFYTEVMDLRLMIKVIRALDPEKYTLVVRVHPRENWQEWSRFVKESGLNVTVSKWDDPFTVWLREVDIVVSPPSTGFYDMLYCGIHPICMSDVFPRRADHVLTESDDNNQILDYIYRPKSVDEIIETIHSGKVPDLSKGVEKVLEGQVSLSIVKNSISNIVKSLSDLPKRTKIANIRFRFFLPLVVIAMVIRSHVKSWRQSLRDGEKGSTFMFTLQRLKMINDLSQRIRKKEG